MLLTGNLLQGYRVGSIAVKLILIDIDSDAGDAASDEVSGEVILYQYTAYFLISPVNIIRPLYRNLVRPSVQLFLNGCLLYTSDAADE